MKKLLLLLLLVGLGGVFGGQALLGGALRKGVEVGGGWAFGTETRLASASVRILGGGLALSGLEVANPAGFKTDRAVRVGRIAIEARWRALLSDPVEIARIEVESPEVTLEMASGGTNLGKLLSNLDARRGPKGPAGEPAKRLRIGLVRVVAPRVRVAHSLGIQVENSLELPSIEFRDIGAGGDVTLPELLLQTLGRIAAASAGAGIPAEISALLKKETALKALKDVRKQVEGAVKDLEGLFEKRRPEK